MIVTKIALPRRTFLRGLGATLSLPLLDAMVPAMSAAGGSARRLGFVYLPMGTHQPLWIPKAEGALTELSPILSSLTPHLSQVSVLSNLQLKNAYSGGADHATANCTFLSGVRAKKTDGSDYELGTTVDQIAARHISRETPLPSLELATDFNYVVGNCDNGYACVYMNTLAWSTPTQPLPTEANPRVVFERMFGDGGSLADRKADLHQNASILDGLSESMAGLQRRLGAGDRTKVNNYLESLQRGRASHSAGRAAGIGDGRHAAGAPCGRAAAVGRPRQADVRSSGARIPGRHYQGHHVPGGTRSEHAHVSADWCAGCASSDLAPPARSRED